MTRLSEDDIALAKRKRQQAKNDDLKASKCRLGTRPERQSVEKVTSTGLADTCVLGDKRLVVHADMMSQIGCRPTSFAALLRGTRCTPSARCGVDRYGRPIPHTLFLSESLLRNKVFGW